jgi:hypothetical protein
MPTVTSSLAVAPYRLPTADVPLPLGSRKSLSSATGFTQERLTTSEPQPSSNLLTHSLINQLLFTSLKSSEPESQSELLYSCRFIANQFVLVPSPLSFTTWDFFLRSHSLCNILSDELTNYPAYISARTAKKTPLLVFCIQLLPWKHAWYRLLYICLSRGRCLAAGLHATIISDIHCGPLEAILRARGCRISTAWLQPLDSVKSISVRASISGDGNEGFQ